MGERLSFEARPDPEQPWIWEVWDIDHPAACNHYPVLRVDSKGAADDLHEEISRVCAEALCRRFPPHLPDPIR